MRRSMAVLPCLLVLLISSAPAIAQDQRFVRPSDPAPNPANTVISAHELQIPEKARELCDKGTRRYIAGKPAASIREFQKAIKISPGFYEAYAKLGAAEMELNHWDDAEASLRKSIALSGDTYAPADFLLGLLLTTVSHQYSAAESSLRAGLALAPYDETGHFILGWLLYSTSRLPEAEDVAREAIADDPSFGAAHLLLAQIHLKEKNTAAVAKDIDEYFALGVPGPADGRIRAVRADAERVLNAAR